jgi:hypothetical protein
MPSKKHPSSTRNIPEAIQREVRKRCGFGCVVCGCPIYEYDHIWGYRRGHAHIAKEITLLCDLHHKEKTNRLLPSAAVLRHDRNPYNMQRKISSPYNLHYEGEEAEIVLAGSRYISRAQQDMEGNFVGFTVPLVIDNVPMLAFTLVNGHIGLDTVIYDESNNLILDIHNNELKYTVGVWDIEFVGQQLMIREKARKFLIDVKFETPNRIIINRGRFLLNGIEVLISPEKLIVTNKKTTLMNNTHENAQVGIAVGKYTLPFNVVINLGEVVRHEYNKSTTEDWIHETFDS